MGRLNTDTAPALINYTLTPEDLKGPFGPIPSDAKDQAKLPSLGYTSPLEQTGEKFHSSPELLQALNPGANFEREGQQLMVPNVLVMPPAQAGSIVVSKGESSVRAYDASGVLLAFYAATIGSEHDPLPLGEWKINGVAREPKFHYNPELFWDAKNQPTSRRYPRARTIQSDWHGSTFPKTTTESMAPRNPARSATPARTAASG